MFFVSFLLGWNLLDAKKEKRKREARWIWIYSYFHSFFLDSFGIWDYSRLIWGIQKKVLVLNL